jgi:hypothetical protein
MTSHVDSHPKRYAPEQNKVERILTRRLSEKRLDGFTLETSLEILDTLAHPASAPAPAEGEVEQLRHTLHIFREFVIRNTTQWEPGCNHHHPIWAMVAEAVGVREEIRNGPLWRFIQPGNEESIAALTASPKPGTQEAGDV